MLNVANVNAESAQNLKEELEKKYDAPVVVKNALAMDEDDISEILESVLLEFSVKTIDFDLPRWVQALPIDCDVVREIIECVKDMANDVDKMRDYDKIDSYFENATFWKQPSSISLDAGKGRVHVKMSTGDDVFFKVASEQCGIDVKDDFDLLKELKILCKDREKIGKIQSAMEQVETSRLRNRCADYGRNRTQPARNLASMSTVRSETLGKSTLPSHYESGRRNRSKPHHRQRTTKQRYG